MKLIILSDETLIDGVIRERGECVLVADSWTENVRREIGRVNVAEVEVEKEKRKAEIKKRKRENVKTTDGEVKQN